MIKKAQITCEGTRPFLFHHLAINFLSTDRKTLSGTSGNNPEEWKNTVLYEKKKRQLYVPSSYILGSFRNGSLYTKVGRGTIMKKVVATLMVVDETILFDRYLPEEDKIKINEDSEKVYLDVRAVRNPNTKGSNLRYRVAMKKEYKFKFGIMWDDSIVSEDHMRNVARDAGMLVGIGDGRSIGYGRYSVEEFKIIK
jgi:hypothetical protein